MHSQVFNLWAYPSCHYFECKINNKKNGSGNNPRENASSLKTRMISVLVNNVPLALHTGLVRNHPIKVTSECVKVHGYDLEETKQSPKIFIVFSAILP